MEFKRGEAGEESRGRGWGEGMQGEYGVRTSPRG